MEVKEAWSIEADDWERVRSCLCGSSLAGGTARVTDGWICGRVGRCAIRGWVIWRWIMQQWVIWRWVSRNIGVESHEVCDVRGKHPTCAIAEEGVVARAHVCLRMSCATLPGSV